MATRRPILRFSQPAEYGPGHDAHNDAENGYAHKFHRHHNDKSGSPERDYQKDHKKSAPLAGGAMESEDPERTGPGAHPNTKGKSAEHHKRMAAKRAARIVMHDILAGVGEFVGTFMFLFLSFVGAQSASFNAGGTGDGTVVTQDNQTILFIALSFGMSLVVVAWVFFRITGSAFNPAVTLALWLVGNLSARRAAGVAAAQFVGGIAAAAVAKAVTLGKFGVNNATVTGLNSGKAMVIEMLTTAMLVFTVMMLAAEKSKGTFLAPVAIGLALFVGHLASVGWTGAGINPARTLGPSVVTGQFQSNAWVYYVGQFLGAILSTALYVLLKHLDYEEVVAGIETADAEKSQGLEGAPLMKLYNKTAEAVPGMAPVQQDAEKPDEVEQRDSESTVAPGAADIEKQKEARNAGTEDLAPEAKPEDK